MKRKLLLVISTMLILSIMLMPSTVLAAQSEVGLAQEAGQAWLNRVTQPSEWIGACLANPQVYHNLKGEPNAYMFTIENKNIVVGHIIVGSSAYGFSVFEAGEAAPPSIPSTTEVQSIVKRDLGIDARRTGEPIRLLYLGFDHLYALYKVDGHKIGVNLIFQYSRLLSELKAYNPSPEVYKANKKATDEAKPEVQILTGPVCLTMSYYNDLPVRKWCGPCSGVSIGRYYRDVQGYEDLTYYDWNMYDLFYYTFMYAWFYGGAVLPTDYGPGFVDWTEYCGYENFSHANDWIVSSGDYWNRVSDINNGWPIAILSSQYEEPPGGGGDFPPDGWHWIAMKGYQYPYGSVDHAIICTDSYSSESNLYLDWDNLGSMLFTCTIKD